MNITEVRVKLVPGNHERLRAFCSVTLDGALVIRDLKVIDGINGPFVAMPSRKLTDHCPKCKSKNHLRARFCNDCGAKLNENRAPRDPQGRLKLHADLAHPIHSAGREELQKTVIAAYQQELERSEQPGYEPQHLDFDDLGEPDFDESPGPVAASAPRPERIPPKPVPRPAASRDRPSTTDRSVAAPPADDPFSAGIF